VCVPICIRLLSVVAPVPPLATGKVPVEILPAFKLVNPDPEPLNVPPCTVPEKVGFVFKTTLPEPVLEVTPVPPSLTAKVPVIADAPRLTASWPFSMTKPPFAFLSTERVCVIPSPEVAPVLAIPSPPVTVPT